eukprot:3810415-Amphidinium_carterae.1
MDVRLPLSLVETSLGLLSQTQQLCHLVGNDRDSHLCSTIIASDPRIRLYRVTEEMDSDDVDTLNLALDAIEAHKDGLPIFVWGTFYTETLE